MFLHFVGCAGNKTEIKKTLKTLKRAFESCFLQIEHKKVLYVDEGIFVLALGYYEMHTLKPLK